MLTRINKTVLFSVGWFLVLTFLSIGPVPTPNAFLHFWPVELSAAVFLGGCCIYFAVRPPKEIEMSRDEFRLLIVPMVVLILWSAASAQWAPSWRSALHHALVWALYLIFYLIVRQIVGTKTGLQNLGFALIAYLSIYSLVAISGYVSYLVFGAGANFLGRLAKYGEQIVTILPLLLVSVVGLKGRSFAVGTAILALFWLLIICSFGRINLYLFGIGFVSTAVLLVLTQRSPRSQRTYSEPADDASVPVSVSSAFKKLLIITAAVIIAPIVVQTFSLLSALPDATPGTFQRLADKEALDSSNNFRHLMNSVSKEMILTHPLVGIGADNFGFQVNEYRKFYAAKHPDDVSLREAEDTLPERAHNEFLQIAAELGIVGVLVVLWFGAGLVLLAYRAARNLSTGSLLAVAAVIGLGAFCVSSLVSSYSFRLVQNGFVFFFVLAVAWQTSSGSARLFAEKLRFSGWSILPGLRLRRRSHDENGGTAAKDDAAFPEKQSFSANRAAKPQTIRALGLPGLLACLLMIGYWTPRIASVSYTNAANYTQDLGEAERLYGIAENLDDENPDARYYHGMRLFQETRYAEAVPYLASAIKIGRGPAVDFSYLASAQSLSDNDDAAELTMAEAFKLYPQSAFVMTRYSHLLKINGKDAESSEMLARARSRSLADANTWWTLLNEGSDAAAMKAIKSPDQYKPLMDLQPLNAVYAVRTEREIRFPEEKKKVFF